MHERSWRSTPVGTRLAKRRLVKLWPISLLALALAACTPSPASPSPAAPDAGSPPTGTFSDQPATALAIPAAQAEADATPADEGMKPLLYKAPRLQTRWFGSVSKTNPLPEYPRPQFTRSDWRSLNGQWQFAAAPLNDQAPPIGKTLGETVLVPYPTESALSGIKRHEDRMWYRRTFTIPQTWNGRNVLLNFGAVDYRSVVYVNGSRVGAHVGGYDGFSFDITAQLKTGQNELIVDVEDQTADSQPRGKQIAAPDNGIYYTPTSGIWQTVWLEPVAAPHISNIALTPDVPAGTLKIKLQSENTSDEVVQVTAYNGTTFVNAVSGPLGTELSLPIPNARLWSPSDPFLYNLTVRLKSGATIVDTVGSYFGMRSIGVGTVNGVQRTLLNGKFVFQLGTLDQGFWPDGLYTAPTDEALKSDLDVHKSLGFNMVRKHIKVEPQRWFYWADKLGLLVWQDMPSLASGPTPPASSHAQFESELKTMIDQHRSSPSIVTWVPFNEGWGEYEPARIADMVKAYDPTRLVDNMSGFNCCGFDGGNGDVVDWHVYTGPGSPPIEPYRARVLGEWGGLGLRSPGHEWNPSGNTCCYELQPDRATLNARYLGLIGSLKYLMLNKGLNASVYTQISDVESELNGLQTYDRDIVKLDAAPVKAAQDALIAASNDAPTVVDVKLPLGFKSFQASTAGSTDRSLRHREGLAWAEAVSATSPEGLKADATFGLVKGLADPACYSFQSKNFPNRYLRHSASRVRNEAIDGSSVFRQDATWCARKGLSGGAGDTLISFESVNFPGKFLRNFGGEIWLAQKGGPLPSDNAANFEQDATWNILAPWSTSTVSVPAGLKSLQVVTPGFTERFVLHRNSLGVTDIVNAGSPDGLKADATFNVVPGLADPVCTSFESKNFPGSFLRHADFRIRLDASDNSGTFKADATFCPRPGLSGKGYTFESFNTPGYFLRHANAEVWIASGQDLRPGDSHNGLEADASFTLADPWSPAAPPVVPPVTPPVTPPAP